MGGKTKSLLLGGTKTLPSARKLVIERTHTPHEIKGVVLRAYPMGKRWLG